MSSFFRGRRRIAHEIAHRPGPAWLMAAPLLLALVCAPFPVFAKTAPATAATAVELPSPDAKHRKAFKLVNYLVDRYHYKDQELDDAFSETVLERYLKQLDPNRSFFLQPDITEFDKLGHHFDDYIRGAVLQPAYEIFNIYRTRVEERSNFALQRLAQPFDFAIEERYPLDREEAPWAATEAELDDLWRRRIKNDILNLRLTGKSEKEIEKTLVRRYTHLARRTRQLSSDDVFQIYVNAYVGAIEPHTSYFSPRATENFKIHMRLSLEGIGAVLQTDNEYTQIRSVVAGGPADLSGELHNGDRIIGVGQDTGTIEDVIGWRLDDVVELIRGHKGTVVQLEILPKASGLEGPSRKVSITRDEIKLEDQAAKKEIIEVETRSGKAKFGVIDLPSFYVDFDAKLDGDKDYRSTTRDVRRLLAELQKENLDGLIIDLRGNGGGALTEAISLTGLFIRKGPVVQVQEATGDIEVDADP
ncbi:MAG: S41 family peptidase, partial [Pseudomonadota bacterium]|nr:S41 family peptidase [Pseudomonadota bacterium]